MPGTTQALVPSLSKEASIGSVATAGRCCRIMISACSCASRLSSHSHVFGSHIGLDDQQRYLDLGGMQAEEDVFELPMQSVSIDLRTFPVFDDLDLAVLDIDGQTAGPADS